MSEVKEMINIWLDEKRTVALLIRESKKCKEQLKKVEQEVEMRRKTQERQTISGKEESIIGKTIAEYRKKKSNNTQIAETGLNKIAETSQTNRTNEIAGIAEDLPNSNEFAEIAEYPLNSNYNTIHAV